jgi:hypothetical protein
MIASVPTAVLATCSFIANLPTAQNEHANSSQMTVILDLDNDTLANYAVSMRVNVCFWVSSQHDHKSHFWPIYNSTQNAFCEINMTQT